MTDNARKAMEIGEIFMEQYMNDTTANWSASEECAMFCWDIIVKAKNEKISVREAMDKYAYEIINIINGTNDTLDLYLLDRLCNVGEINRGFIAGEILGCVDSDYFDAIEKIWEEDMSYGYFQELCEDVKNRKILVFG